MSCFGRVEEAAGCALARALCRARRKTCLSPEPRQRKFARCIYSLPPLSSEQPPPSWLARIRPKSFQAWSIFPGLCLAEFGQCRTKVGRNPAQMPRTRVKFGHLRANIARRANVCRSWTKSVGRVRSSRVRTESLLESGPTLVEADRFPAEVGRTRARLGRSLGKLSRSRAEYGRM